MLYKILPFLVLLLHASRSSANYFRPTPSIPKLGEKLFLVCELNAPKGQRFSSIAPDLIIGNIEFADQHHQFNFDQIQSKLNDSRYRGYVIQDLNGEMLQAFIFITSLEAPDQSIQFICLQSLINDTVISESLTLSSFFQTTTPGHTSTTNIVDAPSTQTTPASNTVVPSNT